MSPFVQVILTQGEGALAYIVGAEWRPTRTEFVTPDSFPLQMGMIVYGKGQEITPHMHIPVVREVHGTCEVVLVRSGACDVDIYDSGQKYISTHALKQGDVILLLKGGHGFKMNEDTVLFEVKQGPYVDGRDKERFR